MVSLNACITGACAAVLVFSTTDQVSFQAITRWKDKVRLQKLVCTPCLGLQQYIGHTMQQACRFENDLRVDMMQIEAESGPIAMALVQNKVDLMDQVGTLSTLAFVGGKALQSESWLVARHCNLGPNMHAQSRASSACMTAG